MFVVWNTNSRKVRYMQYDMDLSALPRPTQNEYKCLVEEVQKMGIWDEVKVLLDEDHIGDLVYTKHATERNPLERFLYARKDQCISVCA